MAEFIKSFNRCMAWEGWSVDDVKDDKGGLTCCGISIKYNPSWIGFVYLQRNGCKIDNDVKNAVMAFYLQEYNAHRLGEIESQTIADQVYQCYINIGRKALRWAQEIAGTVPDGIIGNITLHALNDYDDFMFTTKYADKQIAFYDAIIAHDQTQKKFEVGWKKRANDFRSK